MEGHNLEVERYSGEGRPDRYIEVAKQVVGRGPTVIFVATGRLIWDLKRFTATIPIVGVTGDPIAIGLTLSLARPSGNVTGVTDSGWEIMGKRFQILQELLPNAKRIGYLIPKFFWQTTLADDLKLISQRAGITLIEGALGNPIDRQEYARVFATMAKEHIDALIVAEASENTTNRQLIVELASKAKLPTMYPWREYVTDGGLIGHISDLAVLYRHAAGQVSEILQGTKIEEVPFYQATTYNLKINLKTAKELGLTVPPTLLSQADEVIE